MVGRTGAGTGWASKARFLPGRPIYNQGAAAERELPSGRKQPLKNKIRLTSPLAIVMFVTGWLLCSLPCCVTIGLSAKGN
jgi:hypothetical protein